MSIEPEDAEPVPKLPRGRGLKLSGPELFRIVLTLVTLVGVIVLTRPCANAVSKFVTSFDQGSDQTMPEPGNVDVPAVQQYERLEPGMSEAEIKAAIERSKANAAGGSAATAPGGSATTAPAGSAATAPAGSGSAATAPSARAGSSATPAHGAAEDGSGARSAPATKP